MAQPVAYSPTYNFSTYEAGHPGVPAPGSYYDTEFGNVKITTDQIRANLVLLQRDDGALANGIVTRDSLATSIAAGVNTPVSWATATAYTVRDSVIFTDAKWYWAATNHTSGVFATDLAAGKWQLIFDFTSTFAFALSSSVPVALGGAATAGVAGVASRADHVHALSGPLGAIGAVTAAADKLPYFTGASTAAVTDFSALARTIVADSTPLVLKKLIEVYC